MAVRGELHAIYQMGLQVFHELGGLLGIAATHQPRHDELAVCVDNGPGPDIASEVRGGLGSGNVLGLGVAKRPDPVALDASRGHCARLATGILLMSLF